MFVRSFRDRAITYWNEGAERLYGWTRDEAIGRQPADLLGSQYPIPLEEIERQLEISGRWEGEILQRRKDGSRITVLARWGLQTDAASQPQSILEINSDVSREKLAIDELSRSEERFALLVSAVIDYAIFMLDTTVGSSAGTKARNESRVIQRTKSSVSISRSSTRPRTSRKASLLGCSKTRCVRAGMKTRAGGFEKTVRDSWPAWS